MYRQCGKATRSSFFCAWFSCHRAHSAPYGRRFDGQATATPGHEQFKIDIFVGAEGTGFSPHGGIAPGKHAVRGAEGLPGMAIDRKTIRLTLANDIATQPLSGIAIVAMGTGEVELAASLLIQGLAGCEERLGRA